MIAVVGGFGVGMTMRLERAPEAGETVTGGSFSSGAGGKGSNQAIAIARLGQSSSLFTAVGNDSAADNARTLWQRENVASAGVVALAAPTMTGFILVDAEGENRIAIAPGALDALLPEHLEPFRADIREAELLVVSLEIPWPVARRALEIAREEGTPTLLNPAPARTLTPEEWQLVDIVTPNATEVLTLLGRPLEDDTAPDALAAELAQLGGCRVVVTLGAAGAVIAESQRVIRVGPRPPSSVVDTTGAGDAFTAALAVALVEGHPLAGAVEWACSAGAHAVTIAEVIPSLPTRAHLPRLIDSPRTTGTTERQYA